MGKSAWIVAGACAVFALGAGMFSALPVHAAQKLPIRYFVLDTLGQGLRVAPTEGVDDPKTDGELREVNAAGATMRTWKVKYAWKGHNRKQCDPPMFNISFDKKDKKGNPKTLFNGRSTFSGFSELQYQKIRIVPDCDTLTDYSANLSASGFDGTLNVQLREYVTYDIMRYFKVPTLDPVAFAEVSFVSPEAKYTGKKFRYTFFQRDNEKDDQIPFTKQFNLDNNLIEDGNPGFTSTYVEGVDDDRFSKVSYIDNTQKKTITIDIDPENAIRVALLTDFMDVWDRGTLHNEDYGKDLATGKWKIIPYGFDWAFTCSAVGEGKRSDGISVAIYRLPAERQEGYWKTYYRVAKEIFGNPDALDHMLGAVDQFPFPVAKDKLKTFLQLNYQSYATYFGSREFAARAGVLYVPWTGRQPYPAKEEYDEAFQKFLASCPRKILAPSHVSVVMDEAKLELSQESDVPGKSPGTLRGTFQVTIKAVGKDVLVLKNGGAFRAMIAATDGNASSSVWNVYYGPSREYEDTVGPNFIIPAGKTTQFSVQASYDTNQLEAGMYEMQLTALRVGNAYADVVLPVKPTNAVFTTGSQLPKILTKNIPPTPMNEKVRLIGKRFAVGENLVVVRNGKDDTRISFSVISQDGATLEFVPSAHNLAPGDYQVWVVTKAGQSLESIWFHLTRAKPSSLAPRLAELRAQIAALQAQIAALKAQLAALRPGKPFITALIPPTASPGMNLVISGVGFAVAKDNSISFVPKSGGNGVFVVARSPDGFTLSFIVPNLEPGQYDVWVSNGAAVSVPAPFTVLPAGLGAGSLKLQFANLSEALRALLTTLQSF